MYPDALHISCRQSSFPPVDREKIPRREIRHFSPERELINEGSRLKSEIAPVSGVGCVISRHDRKWREREREFLG